MKSDQLEALVKRHTDAAAKEALESGDIPAYQLESLERLGRLLDIHKKVIPGRERWLLPALLAVSLLIASVLLFARVPETDIEFDGRVYEVEVVLAGSELLTPRISLSALGASGLREVALPRSRGRAPLTLRAPGADGSVAVSMALDDGRPGTIDLDSLTLPAGTRVRFSSSDRGRQLTLSVSSKETIQASVNGALRVASSAEPALQMEFTSPQPVLLQPQETGAQLQMRLLDPDVVSSQLAISALSLFKVRQIVDSERTVVRQLSTMVSGTLYFEALNGRALALRQGEAIEFSGLTGEIRTLELTDQSLALRFHGRVHGLHVGSGEGRRTAMPTWLEWMQARHGLSLLWGAAFYLFGLLSVALRWWKGAA